MNDFDPEQHKQFLTALDHLDQEVAGLQINSGEIVVVRDNILAVRQFLTLWAASAAGITALSNARDLVMADRTAALANATPDSRVALWAHNAHIAKTRGEFWSTPVIPMGLNLKARFVDDIVIVGIVFGAGSYQGVEMENDRPAGLGVLDIGEPPADSLDGALFAASNAPVSILNPGDVSPTVRTWLGTPLVSRTAGAALLPDAKMHIDLNVIQSFDVLAFVRETTAATML